VIDLMINTPREWNSPPPPPPPPVIVSPQVIASGGGLVAGAHGGSSFQLPSAIAWFDTRIFLSAGETVTITASGAVSITTDNRPDRYKTPDGDPNQSTSNPDFHVPFIAQGLTPWSLVGKIGDGGRPFQIGHKSTFTVQSPGELYLSINDNNFADNSGSWSVTVTHARPAPPQPPAPPPPRSSSEPPEP